MLHRNVEELQTRYLEIINEHLFKKNFVNCLKIM